jgi:DUF1365 family protein
MSASRSCAYVGHVVHKRLVPRPHAFSYRVFTLCLDVDEIDAVAARLRLLSRGRWNLLSFHDRDHAAGTGEPVGSRARTLLHEAGLGHCGSRIELVCYPRLIGFVFNPLSVYFAYDAAGELGAIIYEVTNTLKERRSYVIPVTSREQGGVVSQTCGKELYVSPFTAGAASYGFHVVPPCERIVVGVDLREQDQPVLKTHFRGERIELSDRAILGLLVRYPLMTFKVVAAIHLQALRLWLKGIPVQPYHASPRYSFTAVTGPAAKTGKTEHA